MYVVKRSFRNCGEVLTPGSIVEPGTIKRFRSLLSDNHIVEVNEHNFDKWQEFFDVRFGVKITLPVVAKVKTETAKAPTKTTKATTTKAATK